VSSGAKVVSAYVREVTPGVTPLGVPWNLLKRTSWGVGPSQNTNDNDEIGGTRMAQGLSMGTVDVGGDVGTKLRYGQHDEFLASCFGADWVGDSLTMGNSRITFTLGTYATDVGISSAILGAQVGTWQMEVPNDGDVTATVTFAGLNWLSNNDGTNYILSTPVDNAGELRYTFKEVTDISLNGVDGGDGFCIDTFSIQFDNNMQTQRCIGTGSPYAGANIPTTFTPSGSITLSWSKDAWEVWSKTLTGESVPFSFTLANDEGQYAFYFPKVQVAGDWPDGGNTDIIQVQLDITAADESPTITRKVTVPATGISVAPTTVSVDVGDTTAITATLTPANATDHVTWTSYDPTIATVDSDGVVTGVSAGTVNIVGKARAFTAASSVTVTEP
jgi:uncharacterized protein YjdB